MKATPEQKERFKNMVRDFAKRNDLRYQTLEFSDRPSRMNVRFSKDGWGTEKHFHIDFEEFRSLTEAGTFVFTETTIHFRLQSAIASSEAPTITNVLYSPPATVVFWSDGSKTVVKCGENDEFDPEKGLAMAISKKMLGNQGNYYNEFKKWTAKCEVESLYPKLEIPAFGISWEPPEPQKLADIIRERLASIFGRGALG